MIVPHEKACENSLSMCLREMTGFGDVIFTHRTHRRQQDDGEKKPRASREKDREGGKRKGTQRGREEGVCVTDLLFASGLGKWRRWGKVFLFFYFSRGPMAVGAQSEKSTKKKEEKKMKKDGDCTKNKRKKKKKRRRLQRVTTCDR